jgi:hypothetical protein
MRKFFWITAFSISMGLVEAGIAIYLRAVYYPDGFSFPLKMIRMRHFILELGREAATIVMLISVSALISKKFWEQFAYFLVCFGIWDIFYYVWLKIAIGWPVSLLDWDVLFLIPLPWIGPVIAPVSVAVMMILAGLFIIFLFDKGYDFRPSFLAWILTIIGTLIILYSFMRDIGAGLHQHMPLPYRYEALLTGEFLYLVAIVSSWKNTVSKALQEET